MAKAVMIALLLGVTGKTYAYDFSAVCETGQTLYYIITDAISHKAALCFPGESAYDPWPSDVNKPIGNIILPESVQYNGVIYSVNGIGTAAFRGCSDLIGSLTIPNSVISILESAFLGCSGITSIIIPESVNEVGESAFHGTGWYNNQPTGILYLNGCCIEYKGSSPIGTLSLDANTRLIANNVFYNCTGLTGTLVIPDSVESIGKFSFYGCTGLTGLIIGNSVASIKQSAFAGCYNISGSLILPNSLVELGPRAFSGCGFTGSLVIGNSLPVISIGCFSQCSGFTGNLVVPASVTSIGDNAFEYCSGFDGNLTFGNSLVSIGYQSFYYCSGLNSISIPISVTKIGYNAFYNTGWYNNQPDGILYANNCCLGYKGNKPAGTLCIQEDTRIIAENAFFTCTELTGDLIIPNSVTHINNMAFNGCTGLNGSLNIGNSVISLGNMTFGNCNKITEIVSNAIVPPTMVAGGYFFSFKNVPNTIPVYVPNGTMAIYMTTPGWNTFTNYQEMPPVNTTQTVELSAGWNWFSPNVEITLEDLQDALVDALPNANSIMIKSKNGIITYNGDIWRGQLDSLDVTQMYRISVSTACEITLEGIPIIPAEHPVTIHNGVNWIGFPLSENMTLNDAFAGFVVAGDMVKSKNGVATYNGTDWRGSLDTLESGQGYIYKSIVQEDRIFTFPVSTK